MKILFLELNEFNFDLLQEAGQELRLKNIQRLCNFHKSETWTNDTYESDWLEPWVQWVSVHTGVPSTEHKIKHLGDISSLKAPQIWEKLSKQGISSGVWGAMNASKREATLCSFFLPDLWSSTEKAYPEELDTLLDPLRKTSKNYTSKPKSAYLQDAKQFLNLFKKNGLLGKFSKETALLAANAFRYRFKPFVFISFTDDLSTSLFLKYKARYNPDFSLLFLNSIAHLQHHQWRGRKIEKKDPLAHGFKKIDRILGQIFEQMGPEDMMIVTNALSQMNTAVEKPWILYRQIDQKKFLQTIGIQDVTVESHMTHDAHLHFENAKAAQNAKEILQSAHVCNLPFFYIESYPDEPTKLFYRIQFTDELNPETHFEVKGKRYPFFELFTAIVKRTGRHTQTGTLLCNQPRFPAHLPNHEISNKILEFFSA